MTLEDIVYQEIANGRQRVRAIKESQPMLMRADIETLIARLLSRRKIAWGNGGYLVTKC